MMRMLRNVLAGIALHAGVVGSAAIAQPAFTVEKLLQDGWEIAGYVAVFENRTLILFKHKDRTHLVQCSILIDVLRNPRTVTVCYELH